MCANRPHACIQASMHPCHASICLSFIDLIKLSVCRDHHACTRMYVIYCISVAYSLLIHYHKQLYITNRQTCMQHPYVLQQLMNYHTQQSCSLIPPCLMFLTAHDASTKHACMEMLCSATQTMNTLQTRHTCYVRMNRHIRNAR